MLIQFSIRFKFTYSAHSPWIWSGEDFYIH
jgi:hypothetical protein